MKRLIALACLAFMLPAPAHAQHAFKVDGEAFTKRFVGHPPHGDMLIEYIRPREGFGAWTKLIGLRAQHLPRIHNDPVTTAKAMAIFVRKTNPKAQMRLITKNDKSEAILDFLTWPPSGRFLEFDVFRYARSRDGHAVVSLQLARRFTDLSRQGQQRFRQQFSKIRASWIKQAAAFDMDAVRASLAQQASPGATDPSLTHL